MEIIIEVFGEALIELIFGVIAEGVGRLFSSVSDHYFHDTKAKRRLRMIIGSLIFAGIFALSIYCLIKGNTPLAIATAVFLLFSALLRYGLFTISGMGKRKVETAVSVLISLSRYAYGISLIVLSALWVNGPIAKPLITTLSSIAIAVFFLIDMHKIRVARKYASKDPLLRDETTL